MFSSHGCILLSCASVAVDRLKICSQGVDSTGLSTRALARDQEASLKKKKMDKADLVHRAELHIRLPICEESLIPEELTRTFAPGTPEWRDVDRGRTSLFAHSQQVQSMPPVFGTSSSWCCHY
uniref:Uncharacterized protein n=1 Tax=Peronospora matthiolae TaxID=2874970 RepID=A0AAV1VI98_9STRA